MSASSKMNSEDFFKDIKNNPSDITGSKWKGKAGIYVIEQPLINHLYPHPVFKVGFARNSLYTRLRNYKTAYGRAPITIHCIMQTGTGAKNVKGQLAHQTEKQVHEELDKLNKQADKRGEYEDGVRISEWFYDLKLILKIVASVRLEHRDRVTFSDKWLLYLEPESEQVGRTRSNAVKIGKLEDVKSSLPVATYRQSTRKPKGNLTVGGSGFKEAYTEEPNASKNKQKDIPTLVKKRLT